MIQTANPTFLFAATPFQILMMRSHDPHLELRYSNSLLDRFG